MTAAIGLTAVAVVGSEPVSTGAAALDLARAEARHRRVIIVDLIGDAPPLRAVVATDDPHGVADAFIYGVSFAALTRPSTVSANVSILTSGSEAVPFADALPSPRWAQLIDHVRARGELIVFAILSSTPAIGALTDRVDCVIAAPSRLHEVLEAVLAAATSTPDPKPAKPPRRPTPLPKIGRQVRPPARVNSSNRLRVSAIVGVAATLLIGFGWVATHRHRRGRNDAASTASVDRADTVTSSAQLAAGASDSAAVAAASTEMNAAAAAAAVDSATGGLGSIDSANTATFAVRVATYPTFAAALRALRQLKGRRQAVTIAPIAAPGATTGSTAAATPVFALMVGAAHTAPPLDTLAAHWPFQSGFAPSVVLRTPFALRLAGGLPVDSAKRLATSLVARGVPAYVLTVPVAGSAVYAGAFESPDQAVTLATSLRTIGLAPVVGYRTGSNP